MRYFITKYALSGKKIDEREIDGEPEHGRIYDRARGYQSFEIGKDAFLSRDDAVKAAEAARITKIASLRKQIAALAAMRFDT